MKPEYFIVERSLCIDRTGTLMDTTVCVYTGSFSINVPDGFSIRPNSSNSSSLCINEDGGIIPDNTTSKDDFEYPAK